MLRNRIEALKRDRLKFPNREHDVKFGLLYQQHDTGQMTSRMQKWGLQSTKKRPFKEDATWCNRQNEENQQNRISQRQTPLAGMAIVVCTKILSENLVLFLSSGVDFSPFIDEFSHDRARSGPNDCNWGVAIPLTADTAGCLRGMSLSRMLACPQKSENLEKLELFTSSAFRRWCWN